MDSRCCLQTGRLLLSLRLQLRTRYRTIQEVDERRRWLSLGTLPKQLSNDQKSRLLYGRASMKRTTTPPRVFGIWLSDVHAHDHVFSNESEWENGVNRACCKGKYVYGNNCSKSELVLLTEATSGRRTMTQDWNGDACECMPRGCKYTVRTIGAKKRRRSTGNKQQ